MIYCLNPDCQNPQNLAGNTFCQSCSSKLLLKDLYCAIEPLGQGGFGRAFRAVNLGKFDEPCVIKQFLPNVQGTQALQKAVELFNQEAKRLYELGKHPQIPELISYFEQEQRLYLVQELIDGQTLQKELEQQGAFSENQVQELLDDLLPVLKFIHNKQVIHRDIKPENIIRRQSDSKLVLIDFGVSKHITQTALARSGTRIGTQGYASIEQIKGGEASPSVDLYSLGMTCFHLLTKIHPFELFVQYGYSWVSSWRQHLSFALSTQLDRVLNKLLQENVNQRYQSADAVIADLQTQASTVPPTIVVTPGKQAASRTPVTPTAIAPTSTPQTASWRCDRTIERHYDSVLSVAFSLNSEMFASGSKDTNIKLWESRSGQWIKNLTGHSKAVCAIAFSPNSEILASGSEDATIKLWQTATGKLINTLTGHSHAVECLTFSPDGRILVSGSKDNTIKLWKTSTYELMGTLIRHSHSFCSVAFSPDNAILASGSADSTIKLWQVKGVKLINTLIGHKLAVYSVAFSPDGTILATGSGDSTIKLWQVNTGNLINTLSGHIGSVYAIAFSPDGRILVSGSGDQTIKLWAVNSGIVIDTLSGVKGHSDWVNAIAFSPNGRILVSGSRDNNIKIWRCD